MSAPRFVFRQPAAQEVSFCRDAFAKNTAMAFFGRTLDKDPRHPETQACPTKERSRLLCLAEFVTQASDVAVLSTPGGVVAGFLLTTPVRPVWQYVVYAFRGIGAESGASAEDVIASRVREIYGGLPPFVFQR